MEIGTGLLHSERAHAKILQERKQNRMSQEEYEKKQAFQCDDCVSNQGWVWDEIYSEIWEVVGFTKGG